VAEGDQLGAGMRADKFLADCTHLSAMLLVPAANRCRARI
jgi:hypothetical protein